MIQPVCIDLFCKQGGAGVGYARAGYTVVGVDLDPQPRYPFGFLQDDWLAGLRRLLDSPSAHRVALIHASPPCQAYTTGGRVKNIEERPRLIEPVRAALSGIGIPFVIENVPESPLMRPTVLCGSMFGLSVRRHRLFETSFELPAPPPCDHKGQGPIAGVYGRPHGKAGAWPGMLPSTLESWSRAMGIDWMDTEGLSQAIPPAYTQWIGERAPR